jgi:mRNA interferase MazF
VFWALLDPTRGSEQAGRRPVIVVSRDAINDNSDVVVCVPCTDASHSSKIYPSQVRFKRGTGGLRSDSVAMCEQVRAISRKRLADRLGHLDADSLMRLESCLRITFDLE